MVIYVSLCDNNFNKTKKILSDLQNKDQSNTYICPSLTFQYLNKKLTINEIVEIRLDLLMICDILLTSQIKNEIIQKEIDLAKKINMEIKYIENFSI